MHGLLSTDSQWSERNWNVFINASLVLCSSLNQTDCCKMECSSNMRNNFRKQTVNSRVAYDVKYHQSHCISHAKMNMSWIWASYNSSVHHCGHCLLHDPTMAAIAEKGPEVCIWSLNQNRSFLGLPGVWKELGTGVAVNLVEIGKTVGKNLLQFTPFSSFADENLSGWLFQWRICDTRGGKRLPFAPFPPCFW